MAVPRRMTRQVQIGLSHSEKAKTLSSRGFYGEALKELNVALQAFEAENKGGIWDDAIAGVLNNAGYVYLFLGNYPGSEDTFRSALALKERLEDRRSIAGTLAGLSDACRGQGKFDESAAVLEEAFDIALALQDRALAGKLMASMDALQRTRCDMPDAVFRRADFDELYVPAAWAGISVQAAHLGIALSARGELYVEADIGFPYLMRDLRDTDRYGPGPFPVLALLFPAGVGGDLARFSVTDEEEHAVGTSASSFDGILFGPGSYHRGGPMPLPGPKQYVYTHGAGHILGWDVEANGWYHAEASIRTTMAGGLSFLAALPFGSVKLGQISLYLEAPDGWGTMKLAYGAFNRGRRIDTASTAFSIERVLYDGPVKEALRLDAGMTLRSGVLCLDLVKPHPPVR